MLSLGRPLPPGKTDAIVVLTGGPGRIDRGIELMRTRMAKRMLVSGVDRDVRPHELAIAYKADRRLFDCCIDLGREARDTRSNASETAAWVRRRGYRSVRLVTSDWHMPRARMELAKLLGGDVAISGDAVRTNPRFATLLYEYHKWLLRGAAILVGAG
ncbi:YdcF family protein [Sphingomonas canadensis]|nr:YdcF family protein [Sphingomonas canadensis]MCW3834859.1 YdcF family protein [Sphingomonas canadensis]